MTYLIIRVIDMNLYYINLVTFAAGGLLRSVDWVIVVQLEWKNAERAEPIPEEKPNK